MAKSSRASTRKANNQRLAKSLFGPVESARAERLSAKLLEIASQSKAERKAEENAMEGVEEVAEDAAATSTANADESMDIDSKTKPVRKGLNRKKIGVRKRSSIVFPKYKDKVAGKAGKKRK